MGSELEEPDADHAYFVAIEERFVQLRGAANLLSSADWQVARAWRRERIPVEVVLAGLETAFARHRERGRRGRISSLRYCRPVVEETWKARLELGVLPPAPRTPPPLAVEERLSRLADLLPMGLPERTTRAQAIRGLSGDGERVEAALVRLEAQWLVEEEARLGRAERQELELAIGRSLAPLLGRLDSAALDQARERLWRQALRRHLELPELSLFASVFSSDEPD